MRNGPASPFAFGDTIAPMGLTDALARKSEQSRAVFNHVRAQRQIANVTIERSIELFMLLEGIDMIEFERVERNYRNAAAAAREDGFVETPCRKCPDA